jgi:hypothetical protein
MSRRRAYTWVLLLVALLNALAGLPLHEFGHLRQALAQGPASLQGIARDGAAGLAQVEGRADIRDGIRAEVLADGQAQTGGPETAAEGERCLWCLAAAGAFALASAGAALLVPGLAPVATPAWRPAAYVPAPAAPPFASRGPPIARV